LYEVERQKKSLTPEFHLLLCRPTVRGFCLREQEWEDFNINGIEDVEFNTTPFDSLVLPEGYKELILAFVESQLKEGDSFEDVINGKGGGLVVLLSGVPGVGKTLTAESGTYTLVRLNFFLSFHHLPQLFSLLPSSFESS
jgi:hypothetical protein